jgi:hypothetical protein
MKISRLLTVRVRMATRVSGREFSILGKLDEIAKKQCEAGGFLGFVGKAVVGAMCV